MTVQLYSVKLKHPSPEQEWSGKYFLCIGYSNLPIKSCKKGVFQFTSVAKGNTYIQRISENSPGFYPLTNSILCCRKLLLPNGSRPLPLLF